MEKVTKTSTFTYVRTNSYLLKLFAYFGPFKRFNTPYIFIYFLSKDRYVNILTKMHILTKKINI